MKQMKLKLLTAILLTMLAATAGCEKKYDTVPEANGTAETGTDKDTSTDKENRTGTKATAENITTAADTQTDTVTDDGTEEKPQTGFPESYKHKSISGKVVSDYRLELPDSFFKDDVHKLTVDSPCYGDNRLIMEKYIDGKEIAEEHPNPAFEGRPESAYYVMADGYGVSVGNGFSYGSDNSKYYSYVGYQIKINSRCTVLERFLLRLCGKLCRR